MAAVVQSPKIAEKRTVRGNERGCVMIVVSSVTLRAAPTVPDPRARENGCPAPDGTDLASHVGPVTASRAPTRTQPPRGNLSGSVSDLSMSPPPHPATGEPGAPFGGFALTVSNRAAPGWRAQAELLRFLLEAPGPEHVAHRAVTALGLLPQIAWAEMVRGSEPVPTGPEVRSIPMPSGRGEPRTLVVALACPQDREDAAFVDSLLDLVSRIHATAGLVRQLADDAHTDPLTGLWNRRAFFAVLDKALARFRRGGDELAVLLCDLDHFKKINDTFGHDAGDRALLSVRDAIAEVTRPSDVAARLGGDEICILLVGTDIEGAVKVGDRLRAALRTKRPLGDHPLTLSIGAADTSSIDSFTDGARARADLLRIADEALYVAKARGRDQVATPPPPPELDAAVTEPIDVTSDAA
ncbi:MAG: GGDEF domain-containing protein [Deltaproteobacteria bacterium]|nr:MAG: GGDEF domain-containing protein [Deltaproteobacteria bacterium]